MKMGEGPFGPNSEQISPPAEAGHAVAPGDVGQSIVPGEAIGQGAGAEGATPERRMTEPEIKMPLPPEGRAVESEPTTLDAARDTFIKAEQNREKYLSATDWLASSSHTRKEAAENYEKAKKNYEKARAEAVGNNIEFFLGEEINLADGRIRAATEKQPGAWEKISGAWKWLGDQNLEKLGWKPRGRFGKIIARGANLRTAIGASLLGVGYFAPPALFLAMGARRVMSGTGAAVFTSEWLKARAEVSRTALSDKEIIEIPEGEIEKKIGDMVIGLRMQGKLASESEEYWKLLVRYQEVLKENYGKYEHLFSDLDSASGRALAGFEAARKKEATGRTVRNLTSLSAGVGAAIGLGPILNYLYGSPPPLVSAAQAVEGARATAGNIGASATAVPSSEAVAFGAEADAAPGPETAVSEGAETNAGTETAASGVETAETASPDANATDGNGEKAPAETIEHKTETTDNSPVREDVQKALEERQRAESITKYAAENSSAGAGAPATAEAAPALLAETAAPRIPDSFEIVVQSGEGPIHEARKAISEYIALSGDEKLKEFTKAQRVLAEEKLYRAMKAAGSIPEKWEVGAKVSFGKEMIEKTLGEVGVKTPEQVAALDKNLAPFTDKVNWNRYNVVVSPESGYSVYKAWDMDEGIRHVAKAAAETAPPAAGVPGSNGIDMASETSNYVPGGDSENGGEDGAALDEIIIGTQREAAVGEAIKETDPELAQQILAAKETAIDSAVERVGIAVSRLRPEEYALIKNVKIGDAIKEARNSLVSGDSTIVATLRKINLYDKFLALMEKFPLNEQKVAMGMTIHQFIRAYYFKGQYA